jgi:hypothetical protein
VHGEREGGRLSDDARGEGEGVGERREVEGLDRRRRRRREIKRCDN